VVILSFLPSRKSSLNVPSSKFKRKLPKQSNGFMKNSFVNDENSQYAGRICSCMGPSKTTSLFMSLYAALSSVLNTCSLFNKSAF